MLECIKGGAPDRYVNQYEALCFQFYPFAYHSGNDLHRGDMNVVNAWGVTNSFPEDVPGLFPVHTQDKIVVKDIEEWQEYVHAPSLDFPDEEWERIKADYDSTDKSRALNTVFIAPGIFEQIHHLCSMENALVYYLTNPDEIRELVNYLADWEMALAEGICDRLHPDVLLHHDDWGSELNSFLRPELFAEFFVEPYKRIYGYYHDHGGQRERSKACVHGRQGLPR